MSGVIRIVFSARTRIPPWAVGGVITTHCGIFIGDHVYEALARVPGPPLPLLNGKVVRTPVAEWGVRYPWSQQREYLVQDQARGEEFVQAQVGKPYDKEWFLGVHWRSSWDDPEKWGCSELAAATLSAAGSPRFYQDKRSVSPMDLWMAV